MNTSTVAAPASAGPGAAIAADISPPETERSEHAAADDAEPTTAAAPAGKGDAGAESTTAPQPDRDDARGRHEKPTDTHALSSPPTELTVAHVAAAEGASTPTAPAAATEMAAKRPEPAAVAGTKKKATSLVHKWEAKINALLAYKREHGDCQVPQRGSELGKWVKNLRYKKEKGKLPAARVAQLEEIGLAWVDGRWDDMYARLRRFREEHGHFRAAIGSHAQLRGWIDAQRKHCRRNTLSEARRARLAAIGFDFCVGQTPAAFRERIAQLKDYAGQHGDCDVPPSKTGLSNWLRRQRNHYRKMDLSEDRVRCLDAAGVDWKLSFEERLAQLQQYAAQHGDCNPPPNHFVLGKWAKLQRQAYKKNKLPEESVASLDALGFSWNAAPPRAKVSWAQRYETLKQYKLLKGDCNAPRSHPHLGCWVDHQRRLYRKGKLPQDLIANLDELNFNWGTVKKNSELSWQEQYSELCSYKSKHGNCNVPQAATGLGRFVHWQRCVHKNGKLSAERITLLDELAFNWGTDAKGPPLSWDSRLAALRRYKDAHGDCKVPRDHPACPGLERWVHHERCRLEKLPAARKQLLLALGLTPIGNLRRERWEERFRELLAHRKALGDGGVVRATDLGKWVGRQRACYRKGTLPAVRAARLRDAGFAFDPGAVADSHLPIAPGKLELALASDVVGAKVTGVEATCRFGDCIAVGDRLITIDGKLVTKKEDLIVEREGVIGIARNKRRATDITKSKRTALEKEEMETVRAGVAGSVLDVPSPKRALGYGSQTDRKNTTKNEEGPTKRITPRKKDAAAAKETDGGALSDLPGPRPALGSESNSAEKNSESSERLVELLADEMHV